MCVLGSDSLEGHQRSCDGGGGGGSVTGHAHERTITLVCGTVGSIWWPVTLCFVHIQKLEVACPLEGGRELW